MSWVFLALGSALAFRGSVRAGQDSHPEVRAKSQGRSSSSLGLIQFGLAAIVIPLARFSGYGIDTALIACLSGFLAGIYLVLMFWVMRMQDVSRVVPITSTHPIFVAILAQVFLGEIISPLAWVGIVVTVGGAALMSFGPTTRRAERGQSQIVPFALLMVSSLAFGLSQYLTKVVAGDIDVLSLFVWRGLGLGIACVGIMIRKSMFPDLIRAIRDPVSIGLTVFTEGLLVLVAVILLSSTAGDILRPGVPGRDRHGDKAAFRIHSGNTAQPGSVESAG